MQAVRPAGGGPPKAPQMYKRYGTLKSECAWWSACQRDSVRVSLSSHAIQNTRSPYATVPWVQLYMHSWHGRVVVDVTQNLVGPVLTSPLHCNSALGDANLPGHQHTDATPTTPTAPRTSINERTLCELPG